MSIWYCVEDELHSEDLGDFPSRDEALAEIGRRVAEPWNGPDNIAPCISWRTCGRNYTIVRYDDSTMPWSELSREFVAKISAAGVSWQPGYEPAAVDVAAGQHAKVAGPPAVTASDPEATGPELTAIVMSHTIQLHAKFLVLRCANGVVTLYRYDGGVMFSVPARELGVQPLRGYWFELTADAHKYALLGASVRQTQLPKIHPLVERYQARVIPPPPPSLPAEQYQTLIRAWQSPSLFPAGNARKDRQQHSVWQKWWILTLIAAGAQPSGKAAGQF